MFIYSTTLDSIVENMQTMCFSLVLNQRFIRITVEPLLSDDSLRRDNWPLNRGGHLIEVYPKTTLGVVQFSVYQI